MRQPLAGAFLQEVVMGMARTYIALSCILFPLATFAETIASGTYENGSGLLLVDGDDVEVTISEIDCLGELDGKLARNGSGDWFVLGNNEPRCVMSVNPVGESSISLAQHENCSFYHGATCEFSGHYHRKQ